ncbi:Peroxisome chaperone and import receptor [Collariella sp. IMI 366227]|nr:Peroxisome chaperone and import receptor [Collariella sp. IMI 366227]
MASTAGQSAAPKAEAEGVAAPIKTEEKKATIAEDVNGDVPDPDEDDLDDLDGKLYMLDDFAAAKLDDHKPAAPVAQVPPAAAASAADEPGLSEDDFAKQLQAGMADLLGELEDSPEMQAQPSSSGAGAANAEASFQDTIRQTMERMQTSGDQATAAASAEGSDDFLAELLKQMQGGGLDGEGNEEDFSKMLLGMMEQLTNKEILYEPMKELHEKFPDWLVKNKDKVSAEELKNYQDQQVLVKEIVLKFEEPTYSDANTSDREYIVDRMQKMQASGSPPPDLVGDMPSAQDVMNMPDESCNPQ